MNGEPNSFWLPGIFFPQGLLTAVLQRHARANQLAIDRLAFAFEVLPSVQSTNTKWRHISLPEQKAATGIHVHGLFLESAQWSIKRTRLYVNLKLVSHMMRCLYSTLFPFVLDTYTAPSDLYACPLYRTSARAGVLSTTGHSTNFVLSIQLPTGEYPTRHWVRMGNCACKSSY